MSPLCGYEEIFEKKVAEQVSKSYKTTIVKLMKYLKIYRPEYDLQIRILADNLKQLERIRHEAENAPLFFLDHDVPKEHPLQKALTRERTAALTNLRELGLTPKGLKFLGEINEETTNLLESLIDDE